MKLFHNDQYYQNKIRKLKKEWFTSLALQSLTLCKYNLRSLHFSVCHISWDSKNWKMDQNIMKNKHGWLTCTKVLAFRVAPFPFFCSGRNIFTCHHFFIQKECKCDPKMIKFFSLHLSQCIFTSPQRGQLESSENLLLLAFNENLGLLGPYLEFIFIT